jgi:hypothetical protein
LSRWDSSNAADLSFRKRWKLIKSGKIGKLRKVNIWANFGIWRRTAHCAR